MQFYDSCRHEAEGGEEQREGEVSLDVQYESKLETVAKSMAIFVTVSSLKRIYVYCGELLYLRCSRLPCSVSLLPCSSKDTSALIIAQLNRLVLPEVYPLCILWP